MKEKVYNTLYAVAMCAAAILFLPSGVLSNVIDDRLISLILYFAFNFASGYYYFKLNLEVIKRYWIHSLMLYVLLVLCACLLQNAFYNIFIEPLTVEIAVLNFVFFAISGIAGFFVSYLVLIIQVAIERTFSGYLTVMRSTTVKITKIEKIIFKICAFVFAGFMLFMLKDGYYPGIGVFAFFLIMSWATLFSIYYPNVKVKDNKIWLRKFFFFHEHDLSEYTTCYKSNSGYYIVSFGEKDYKIPVECVNLNYLFPILKNIHNPYAQEKNVKKLAAYIKKATEKPAINLTVHPDEDTSLFTSKIGGLPYWDLKMEYPVDEDGEKMHLLCQLNFSECKEKNELLPKTGMLQFFISEKDTSYGLDFEDQTLQKNWRVVFHKKIDKKITAEQVRSLGVSINSDPDRTPVLKSCALKFESSVSYMNMSDSRFEEYLTKGVEKVTGTYHSGSAYDLLGPESVNPHARIFINAFSAFENTMLSYPEFIQEDPRVVMSEEEGAYFDTVLLQLTSVCGNSEILSWGDGGNATFFINSEALKEKDFSKVLYNWDCY